MGVGIQEPDDVRARAADLGFAADSVACLRAKEDAETWRCTGAGGAAILKWYRGDYAALTAAQRCRKSELAAVELRAVGIPTPSVLAASTEAAALLVEDLGPGAWSDRDRNEAGATLRRLHEVKAGGALDGAARPRRGDRAEPGAHRPRRRALRGRARCLRAVVARARARGREPGCGHRRRR